MIQANEYEYFFMNMNMQVEDLSNNADPQVLKQISRYDLDIYHIKVGIQKNEVWECHLLKQWMKQIALSNKQLL